MSERKDCGRCHLAGVPQVMPSGAIVTDDFCGGCPNRDTGGGKVVALQDATPEERAAFWQRVEQHAAQYASVTVMMPPVFVGKGPPLVVFDDEGGKGDE